ncbi:cytochrome P450 [Phlebopus sp. FC_14]|nr:cytochrome P450 [Phlebopus sp. FC_14]
MGSLTLLDVCLAGVGLYLVKRVLLDNKSPLPPGPAGWPIIGNLFDFPSQKPWLTFASYGKRYGEPLIAVYSSTRTSTQSMHPHPSGDISSLKILGTNMVILNTAKAASDLLDKRSAIFSDRPHFVMAGDLAGWGDLLALQQNSERFKQYRKLFYRHLGSKSSLAVFHPAIEEETRKFLDNVLNDAEDLVAHIRTLAGATILKFSHGYSVRDGVDPLVDLAERSMADFSALVVPGAFLVDVVPMLRYVPEWLPGSGFLQMAKSSRQLMNEAVKTPHQFVLDQLASGNASTSFSGKLLEGGVTPEEEDVIMWASLSMYLGGSDTTVASIYAFFLAMTLYPEIQKRAQAELDSLIGTERLPTFEDRHSLPYVNAVCTELFRWHTVAPQILHDENTYPDPEAFNPGRFLSENPQADPRSASFGYGRRICPGLHLADAAVFMAIAMSLAVFDISRIVENGVEVIPEIDPTEGIVSHSRAFRCKITPRSAAAKVVYN